MIGIPDRSYPPLITNTSLMEQSDYERCTPRMIVNDILKVQIKKSVKDVQIDVRKLVDPNIEYWVRYWVFIFGIWYHV